MDRICLLQLSELLSRAAAADCNLPAIVQRYHEAIFRKAPDFCGLEERDFFEAAIARWNRYEEGGRSYKGAALVARPSSTIVASMLGYAPEEVVLVTLDRHLAESFRARAAQPIISVYFGAVMRLADTTGGASSLEPFASQSIQSALPYKFDLVEIDCTGATVEDVVEALQRLYIRPAALLVLSIAQAPSRATGEKIRKLVDSVKAIQTTGSGRKKVVVLLDSCLTCSDTRCSFSFVIFSKSEKIPPEAAETELVALASLECYIYDLERREEAVAPDPLVVAASALPFLPPPVQVPATKMMPPPPPAVPPPKRAQPPLEIGNVSEIGIDLPELMDDMIHDRWLQVARTIESEKAGKWRAARLTYTTARIAAFHVLVYGRLINCPELCIAAVEQLNAALEDDERAEHSRPRTRVSVNWDEPIELSKPVPPTPENPPRINLLATKLGPGHVGPIGSHLNEASLKTYLDTCKEEVARVCNKTDMANIRWHYEKLCSVARAPKRSKSK